MEKAFLQSALDKGLDINRVNIERPFIEIEYYKPHGKWYTTEFRNLTNIEVFNINEDKGFLLLDEMPELTKDWFTIIFRAYNVDGFCNYMKIAKC